MAVLALVYATLPDHHLAAIVDGHLAAMALATTTGQLDWHAHAVELALDELASRLWGDVA